MLKFLTFSLSFGFALYLSSASQAGVLGHGGSDCATCGLASPQGGPIASAQGPVYSACNAAPACKPKCSLFSGLGHKFNGMGCKLKGLMPTHTVTYEWVLKKKHVWGHKNNCGGNACGNSGCDSCAGAVYPTSQVAPSGQYAAPQATGQYAAPQAASQVYGAGQAFRVANPTTTLAAVPAELTPGIPTGEEAPPAPEVGR
jgi:hypothetical protein